MRNSALGFLAGVVITLIAVRSTPELGQRLAGGFAGSDVGSQQSEQGFPNRLGANSTDQSLADQLDFEQSGDPQQSTGSTSAAVTDVAVQSSSSSRRTPQSSASDASRTSDDTDQLSESENRVPSAFEVPVANELATAFLDPESESYSPSSAENHRELEAQERDASWSAYMEAQIAAYLFSKEEILNQFSIPSIHCRVTLCEVQAIGYGPRAYPAWVAATADAPEQPFFQEFTGAGGPVRNLDGQTLILWYIRKETAEQQGQGLKKEAAPSS